MADRAGTALVEGADSLYSSAHAYGGAAVQAAAHAIHARVGASGAGSAPEVAIILGTGLGDLGASISVEHALDYADIPGFAASTVESHPGRLLLGKLGGRRVAALQGRLHPYEGYSLQQVTFPVRVLRALGAGTLVASNACGGMRAEWPAGDLMMITDHINLLGDNPLVGPNDESHGSRFPDMSQPYDLALRAIARTVANERGITLREGVYVAVMGPNQETRAEYRMLRAMGADAVGMSTVPEVIVARHAGMRVLGLSIITDMCLPDTLQPASLESILSVSRGAVPRMTTLVRGVLERM
ncbi:MAG TPA: purine-nucleoside phosphorylase [Gemmatimonadaceae bacterium]|nr:purine-nucleoside phosphorylase [Gemmatimonadaceae bacterium]